MADNRTMEELLRAPTEGYGEAIVIPKINADHFEIKTNLLQLVQASPFHGFERDNPHTHINNFKRITSSLRFRDVPNDVIKLMMFPYSLEGAARIWYDKEPPNSIWTWEDLKVVTPATVKAVEEPCVTCGGAHAYYNCPNTDSNQSSVCAATGTYNQVAPPNRVSNHMAPPGFAPVQNSQNSQINSLKGEFKNEIQNTMKTQQTVLMNQQNSFQNNLQNMLSGFFQNQASTSGTLLSNTIPNPKCEMKAITTRSGVAYEGPSIPTNPSPKKIVERETEETTDKEQTNFQGSTTHIPPLVNPIPILKPDVPKTLPKPNIPYPSRLNDQKFREKASNQMEKIFQIFQDLRFDISFADALLLMPRFAPTIKNLLMNKEMLFELAKIPLNENCSAMLLKKLPEKLGDPEKFLIPCDFPGMDHANESIKMINFIDVSCVDSFGEILRLKKSNHFTSVSTTLLSNSRPSLVSFETSDSLLEEFTDELALLDLFPPGNEDVDFKADLREIKLLLNRDPSTNFSPTITIDPNPERFTDEPSLSCLPPPGDDESFLKKDVQEENFQIYSNPLFEFDDNHNPSNINPLFKEMLEDVKIKDSNVSNYDEPVLLNAPLFDEDECFNPGGKIDKIDAFMEDYRDSEGNVLEILHNTIHNLFPEVFFDHEPQGLKAYGEFFSIICEIIL
ncbi:hypothetical protein Tco_0908764 [Tanacetum coccineum]|uniref:Reverse transcriptase domain-containing protein n=1 Tax=Tanacetum coccineum TaxID=301880 RepID=A0ABQ5CP55_9ASTR